jgi:hypothetical protein
VLKLTHSWLDKEQATNDNETYNGMGSVAYGNMTLLGERDTEPGTTDGDGEVGELPRAMQPRHSYREWNANCQRG